MVNFAHSMTEAVRKDGGLAVLEAPGCREDGNNWQDFIFARFRDPV